MNAFRALVRRVLLADARRRLRNDLDGTWLLGLDALREASASGPVLVAANHVAWWDGLLAQVACERVGVEAAFLVDARTLDRHPFLAACGALGIDRTGFATARAGLRAAEAFLDRPGRALWVFPQGRHRPAHLRPLDLQRGAEILARKEGVRVVPCAIAYAFADAPRPRAFVSFGEALAPRPSLDDLDHALQRGLARLDALVEAPPAPDLPAPTPSDPASAALAWAWRRLA